MCIIMTNRKLIMTNRTLLKYCTFWLGRAHSPPPPPPTLGGALVAFCQTILSFWSYRHNEGRLFLNEFVVSCSCGSVRLTRSYERTLFCDKRWGCSTKDTHRPECRDTPVQTLKLSTTCTCRFIQGHSFDKREWAILPRFEICSPPAWTGR